MIRMKRAFLLASLALLPALPAHAGPASDAVRFFYAPDHFVTDPVHRRRFVDPAATALRQNDAQSKEGELGCIDFALQYDAQDLDDAEVAKTLKLKEKVSGGTAKVTATFRLFPGEDGSRRSIIWSLKQAGGAWKIADIASASGAWSLSKLGCGAQ